MGETTDRIRQGWRVYAQAAAFLLLSQLLLWPLIHVAERSARPTQMDRRATVEFVALDGQGREMEAGRRFTARLDGNQGYYAPLVKGSDKVRFLLPFSLKDGYGPQGFYLSIRSDTENVRINGQLIQAELPTERQRGDINNEPGYYPLPASALKAGENLLTLESDSFGAVHDLGLFAIGDASDLYTSYRWKSLLVVDLPIAGIAILLFTSLLCFLVNWPADDRARIRALVILLAVSAATTALLTLSPQAQMPLWLTVALYAASSFATGLAAVQYAMHDSGTQPVAPKWILRGWLAVPVVVAAALAMLWFRPDAAGFIYAWLVKISFYVEIALGTLATVLLARAAATERWRLWAERMVLILCFSLFSLDRVASMTALTSPFDADVPLTLPWSPIIGVFLGMAMVISLARQAGEARRTVVESNAILAARLEEQDAELAASYEAQKQMRERQVMLEERQRIVRDMHDGIGGQLLGLMMQVKRGDTDLPAVERELQASIADLRLIVDSMDTAEAGLAESLRAFEHRARPQIEAAGFAFAFTSDLAEDEPGPGPRPTLHILRVLQEAVTNAIRHSGGTAIRIESTYADAATIAISVTDDGAGLPADPGGGRGLANMRHRLASIGGSLDIGPATPGTRVLLRLPRPS